MGVVGIHIELLPDLSASSSSLPTRSAVLPCEVKMLVIATAALLVLSTTAVAASKYNYGGRDSYEHRVYGREYKRFDPYDSYDEGYGGHAYSEVSSYEPYTKSRPTYRHKRSADGWEGQQLLFTAREAQQFPSCIGLCTTKGPTDVDPARTHVPCSTANLATGSRPFCYVSALCQDARRSVINKESLWSTQACCGDTPAPCPGPDFGVGP